MADDTTALQSQLDALRAAYYSGALRVSYESKSVDYRTASELLTAIKSLERKLGIDTTPTRVYPRGGKGW